MASKLAMKKKVESRKTTKVSKKETAKKSSGSRGGAMDDSTTLVRKSAKSDSALWTKFLEAMGAKPLTFGALCKSMKTALKMQPKKVRRITLSLRRRGLIETRGE